MQIWHYQFLNIAWFGHFLKYLQWWRYVFFEAILDSCLYFHSRLNLLRGLLFPVWSFNGWNSLFGDYKVPILGIWSLWQDILLLVNLLYFDGTRVRVKINCLSGSWIHIETIFFFNLCKVHDIRSPWGQCIDQNFEISTIPFHFERFQLVLLSLRFLHLLISLQLQ